MTTAAAKQTAIVTKDELSELGEWERKSAAAKKKVSEAEKELTFRRQSLVERVLGINSADDLKKLAPGKVQKLYSERLAAGDWKSERGAPAFAFAKKSEGCYPSWSQLYIAEMGETAAARVRAETPSTYSYSIEVTQT